MTFQQLESVFQLFLTKHWSMKGKRITNAGMAVNKRDYVTKEELDAIEVIARLKYTILTNGDVDNPEIIFADGDVILVPLI